MHLYLALGVPPIIPVPSVVPHYVEQIHPIGPASKKVPSVTTSAAEVLQKGFKMMLVPHIPLTCLPPHPTEWVNLARIWIMGTSEPKLSASTVHGQGAPLLVEDFEAVGVNLDCSDTWLGFGADINPNTVKTTPTLGDYAFAIIWTALGSLTNHYKGRNVKASALSPFTKGRHRAGDPINSIRDAVRRQVRSSMKSIVKKQAKNVAKSEGTDALKDFLPDGVIEDNVIAAIQTFV